MFNSLFFAGAIARSMDATTPRPLPDGRSTNHELETKARLAETAAALFAERGFNDVTVREICAAARANVAAVNYHYGGKLGLYTQVVRQAIDAMRRTDGGVEPKSRPAEQRLRAYVRAFVQRVTRNDRDSWIHRLMDQELAHPTSALDVIVEQAIRPRLESLGGIVADLLECSPGDERVTRCVASVHAQCLLCVRTAATARLYSKLNLTPALGREMADHIADFSLAGVRALKRQRVARSRSRADRRRAS
jgi:AcrR family transcriptional regulator